MQSKIINIRPPVIHKLGVIATIQPLEGSFYLVV